MDKFVLESIEALSSKRPQRAREKVLSTPAPAIAVPYWRSIAMDGGGGLESTYGTSDDWAKYFVPSATGYLEYDIATATGTIELTDLKRNGVSMHEVYWDNPNGAQDFTFQIHNAGVDTDGSVQITFNGGLTHYTVGEQLLTYRMKSGRNHMRIVRDLYPDGISLQGRLFYPEWWVDPQRRVNV